MELDDVLFGETEFKGAWSNYLYSETWEVLERFSFGLLKSLRCKLLEAEEYTR